MKTDQDHAFWLLAQHNVHRYLMANTAGRLSGYEKHKNHDQMCRKFIALRRHTEVDSVRSCDASEEEWQRVHEATQRLTSHMDTEIGFPIEDTRPDYDRLAPLFAEKFLALAHEASG